VERGGAWQLRLALARCCGPACALPTLGPRPQIIVELVAAAPQLGQSHRQPVDPAIGLVHLIPHRGRQSLLWQGLWPALPARYHRLGRLLVAHGPILSHPHRSTLRAMAGLAQKGKAKMGSFRKKDVGGRPGLAKGGERHGRTMDKAG